MQIKIIEIIKQILLDGRMVDAYGFEPKHPIIYNAYTQSGLSFEEFLESCLLEKAPERGVVWDQNTLSFKGNISANKILELSDAKQDT